MRRLLVLVTLAATAAAQTPTSLTSRDQWNVVEGMRAELNLPGLVVIIVRSDGAPKIIATGWRKWGERDQIQVTDRIHLGSNTKAMTGSLIAALVEQKRITWETTIAQVFPELVDSIRPEYRAVTVRQLMGHASGIHPYTDGNNLGAAFWSPKDTAGIRLRFAKKILREKPLYPPGTQHVYSNAGVSLVGFIAERVTGKSYELLVDSLVFRPLGAHVLWGNPGLASTPQPWGHTTARFNGIKRISPADNDYVVPKVLVPAGDASPTFSDYARFLQMHLRGLRGIDDGLKASTIKELHAAIAPTDTSRDWGAGWGARIIDGVRTSGHSGSAGAYIVVAAIQPSRDVAIAILTNIAGDRLEGVSKLRPRIQQALVPR